MKNLYLTLCCAAALLISSSLSAQVMWDNFEDVRKGTYGFINGTFIPYFGNPDPTGLNTSRVVAQYTRNPAELFDVILLDAPMADLGPYLSGARKMSITVWSPAPGQTVQITLENDVLAQPANFPTGRHSVYLATTTTSMAWETLTFNFNNRPDASVANTNVNRIVLLFQPNTNSSNTWYWDNLRGPEFANDPCANVTPDDNILMDFECNQNLAFTFSHSGVNFRRVLNPDQTGLNTSSYVASYVRNGGEEFDVIIGRTAQDRIIPAGASMSLDVWNNAAPKNVVVSLQYNSGSGAPTDIISATGTTSASSQWQTLGYDFGNAAGALFNQVVILFEPGSFTSPSFFWDNFKFNQSSSTFQAPELVSDFTVFPNPARHAATFRYTLDAAAEVQLHIADPTGRVSERLFSGRQAAGQQHFDYDTQHLPAGMYFYTISVDGQQASGLLSIAK